MGSPSRKAYRGVVSKARMRAETASLRKQMGTLRRERNAWRALAEREGAIHQLLDGLSQSLYAAGLSQEASMLLLKTDPAGAGRELRKSTAQLNRVIREVRTFLLSFDEMLRPGSRDRS